MSVSVAECTAREILIDDLGRYQLVERRSDRQMCQAAGIDHKALRALRSGGGLSLDSFEKLERLIAAWRLARADAMRGI